MNKGQSNIDLKDIDTIIKKNISQNYDKLLPSSDLTNRIVKTIETEQGVQQELKDGKQTIGLLLPNNGRLQRVAVVILLISVLGLMNFNRISAFVSTTYEYLFMNLNKKYDEKIKDYVVHIDEEMKVDGNNFVITDYVITEDGIDIKVKEEILTNENIELVGCEIQVDGINLITEMFAKTDGVYIASNCFEGDISWDGIDRKNAQITILYKNGENICTAETVIDISKGKIMTGDSANKNEFTGDGESVKIESVQIKSWYVKVKFTAIADYGYPKLYYEDREILFISGRMTSDGYEGFYAWDLE